MTDYKEIKKGIKQVEMDQMIYNTKIFLCIILGIIVGVLTKSWILGILACMIPGIISARTYFEINKKDK